jgi:hypothetical protein
MITIDPKSGIPVVTAPPPVYDPYVGMAPGGYFPPMMPPYMGYGMGTGMGMPPYMGYGMPPISNPAF